MATRRGAGAVRAALLVASGASAALVASSSRVLSSAWLDCSVVGERQKQKKGLLLQEVGPCA